MLSQEEIPILLNIFLELAFLSLSTGGRCSYGKDRKRVLKNILSMQAIWIIPPSVFVLGKTVVPLYLALREGGGRILYGEMPKNGFRQILIIAIVKDGYPYQRLYLWDKSRTHPFSVLDEVKNLS